MVSSIDLDSTVNHHGISSYLARSRTQPPLDSRQVLNRWAAKRLSVQGAFESDAGCSTDRFVSRFISFLKFNISEINSENKVQKTGNRIYPRRIHRTSRTVLVSAKRENRKHFKRPLEGHNGRAVAARVRQKQISAACVASVARLTIKTECFALQCRVGRQRAPGAAALLQWSRGERKNTILILSDGSSRPQTAELLQGGWHGSTVERRWQRWHSVGLRVTVRAR